MGITAWQSQAFKFLCETWLQQLLLQHKLNSTALTSTMVCVTRRSCWPQNNRISEWKGLAAASDAVTLG